MNARLPFAALLIFVCAFGTAVAQPDPAPFELFAGYSLLKLGDFGLSDTVGHGFGVGAAWNVTSSLALEANAAGQYGTIRRDRRLLPGAPVFSGSFNAHHLLAGPRATVRQGRLALFGHALAGITRLSEGAKTAPGGFSPSFPDTKTMLTLGLGGGLDVSIGERFSVRPFQLDYLPMRAGFEGAEWRHNVQFQTGIVFKLGQ